jgi:hypothetical protein
VSHFHGKTAMKLPSHLAKSRHGVFYYRLVIRKGGYTLEKRWSLKTRDPAEAKMRALHMAVAITRAKMSSNYDRKQFNFDDLKTWPSDEQLQVAAANNDAIAKALLEIKRERNSGEVVADDLALRERLWGPKNRCQRCRPNIC